jgi:cytochrome P450
VRKKLAASLPKLSLDAPLIDGKTVREDPQFEYLNACIKGMYRMNLFFHLEDRPNRPHQTENLRLHPIASELGRRTLKEPANLSGVEVPPYTVVSASYRSLHQ